MAALWNHLYHEEGPSPDRTLLFSGATEYQTAGFYEVTDFRANECKSYAPWQKALALEFNTQTELA